MKNGYMCQHLKKLTVSSQKIQKWPRIVKIIQNVDQLSEIFKMATKCQHFWKITSSSKIKKLPPTVKMIQNGCQLLNF